jgi:protein SCO1
MEDRLMRTIPPLQPPPGLDREEGLALAGFVMLLVTTAAWWALALWPVEDGPAWLERTRYVCFGVAGNGLPDTGGWIGLIAGPLGMLAILLVGWGRGVRLLLGRARTSRLTAATLATLVIATLALPGSASVRVRQVLASPVDYDWWEITPAEHPRLDRPAPEARLFAHDGSTIGIEQFRGSPVLVTFAYAHCSTVCPLIVRHTLEAQALLGDAPRRPPVLIVTLDPWRDTPSRLQGMARGWNLPEEDAWILGGEVAAVEAALDGWNVARSRDLRTGEVVHPSLTYVVDAEGRIAFAATGGAETIAALVRRLGE